MRTWAVTPQRQAYMRFHSSYHLVVLLLLRISSAKLSLVDNPASFSPCPSGSFASGRDQAAITSSMKNLSFVVLDYATFISCRLRLLWSASPLLSSPFVAV